VGCVVVTVSELDDVFELGDVVAVDSLESLFRAHYGRLVRALTLVSGSRDVAADAVQEAFVKAHLHWRRVSRYDDPVGWIRRVAINGLRDDHRRQSRKAKAEQRMSNERPITLEPGIDESAQMLAALPRQQRLAMALFYVDGMSVAEVARAMKLSKGAVKFHLHKGRERLRGSVVEQGVR
jgi:RNA polymerase sigma-70 factor (ECF subfamily)